MLVKRRHGSLETQRIGGEASGLWANNVRTLLRALACSRFMASMRGNTNLSGVKKRNSRSFASCRLSRKRTLIMVLKRLPEMGLWITSALSSRFSVHSRLMRTQTAPPFDTFTGPRSNSLSMQELSCAWAVLSGRKSFESLLRVWSFVCGT